MHCHVIHLCGVYWIILLIPRPSALYSDSTSNKTTWISFVNSPAEFLSSEFRPEQVRTKYFFEFQLYYIFQVSVSPYQRNIYIVFITKLIVCLCSSLVLSSVDVWIFHCVLFKPWHIFNLLLRRAVAVPCRAEIQFFG